MNDPIEYEIKPAKGWSLNLKELWDYKELFYFFTWRDIKVKYKQTILGFLWVILQPLMMMAIFTFFFGKVLNVKSEGVQYPVFVLSGLILWNLFSSGVLNAGNSMVNNANIIKKIYFPRLIIPMSSILVALFDFFISLGICLVLLPFFIADLDIIKFAGFLILSLIITIVTTFGLGSLLAALNIKYRDFRYIIPFFIQILLFLTPVIYPISIIKSRWVHYILALNPMTGAINLLRNSFVDKPLDYNILLISVLSSLVIFILGILFFKKTEAYFADLS